MKQEIFRGTATALVTPMRLDGSIDFESYGRLIDWQISSGIQGLVTCGTTGESSTMTEEEHKAVIRFAVERASGRVPVIAGTGSNCTARAVAMTEYACQVGADACLVVTPYYNKATQKGLIAHYTAIADVSTRPVILYNVPSRTSCNLQPATCEALGRHPRIAAVKEASGDLSQVADIAQRADLAIYSGNDDQTTPFLSLGASGCISVLSNILPREAAQICRLFFEGKTGEAAELQCRLLPLIHLLFCEVNPIPIKAAVTAMGFGEGGIRLPLTPIEDQHRQMLLAEMKNWGLRV